MIILERPAQPDDHFQDVGPFVVCHCLQLFVVVCCLYLFVFFCLLLFVIRRLKLLVVCHLLLVIVFCFFLYCLSFIVFCLLPFVIDCYFCCMLFVASRCLSFIVSLCTLFVVVCGLSLFVVLRCSSMTMVIVYTWWYYGVNRGQYQLVHGGTGSVEGGTGLFVCAIVLWSFPPCRQTTNNDKQRTKTNNK